MRTAAERISESDDEVRQNIAPQFVALFNKVRGQIKGSKRQTRTEAFLEYVTDHPEEDVEAASRLAEWRLKSVLRPMLDFTRHRPGQSELSPSTFPLASRRAFSIRGVGRARSFAHSARAFLRTRSSFLLHAEKYDLIVSNPPYSHALEFVQHAMTLAPVVCMLLRLPWIASQRRAAWHRENLCHIHVLPKRPSFTADGKTDATEYAWFVWGTPDAGQYSILEIDAADAKRRRA